MCGYSGHALRIAKWAFFLGGVRKWVRRMVEAESVEEQGRIWDRHLRPVLLAPWISRLFLANPYVVDFNLDGILVLQLICLTVTSVYSCGMLLEYL